MNHYLFTLMSPQLRMNHDMAIFFYYLSHLILNEVIVGLDLMIYQRILLEVFCYYLWENKRRRL